MFGEGLGLGVLLAPVAANCLCPTDTSSGSEDEGSVQGDSQGTPTSSQGSINMEHWISQAIHGSTTSTTSSSSTQSGGSGAAHRLADVLAQTHIGECLAAAGCAVLPVRASEWLLSVPTPFSLHFPCLCIVASEPTRGTGQTCFRSWAALLHCHQEGRRGSAEAVLGTSMFSSSETGVSGKFGGRIKGAK